MRNIKANQDKVAQLNTSLCYDAELAQNANNALTQNVEVEKHKNDLLRSECFKLKSNLRQLERKEIINANITSIGKSTKSYMPTVL